MSRTVRDSAGSFRTSILSRQSWQSYEHTASLLEHDFKSSDNNAVDARADSMTSINTSTLMAANLTNTDAEVQLNEDSRNNAAMAGRAQEEENAMNSSGTTIVNQVVVALPPKHLFCKKTKIGRSA